MHSRTNAERVIKMMENGQQNLFIFIRICVRDLVPRLAIVALNDEHLSFFVSMFHRNINSYTLTLYHLTQR